MKLAEALIARSDLQSRLAGLRERLTRSSKVQEGDEPPENPEVLLSELDQVTNQLLEMIQRINKTNNQTIVHSEYTLADLLAKRDVLSMKRKVLNSLMESAASVAGRYSRSEIRMLSTVDVAELQKQADALAGDIRKTDTTIQEHNWLTELL